MPMALVERDAAVLVKDSDAVVRVVEEVVLLINNETKQAELSKNISAMAHPDAAKDIAREVLKMIA